MLNEHYIKIDKQLSDFKHYLDHNSRGILSARFGDGKTYFLKKFIEQHKADYEFITIYPVNYQVAENKDIFEYIKHDILIRQLSKDGFELDDPKGVFSAFWGYLKNNQFDFLESIVKMLPQLNTPVLSFDLSKSLEGVKKICDGYDKYKESVNEEDILTNFINSFDNKKGSIYEFDPISKLVYTLNERYKNKKKRKRKKIVLIIEDLDRIDPAHIFRILNVFSAHFDCYMGDDKLKDSNKFGFDKIITVCHFENISNIYHHLYGEKTDFSGYIGKFSTAQPFTYSLNDVLYEYIKDRISEIVGEYYPNVTEKLTQLVVSKHSNHLTIDSNIREIRNALDSKPMLRKDIIEIEGSIKISTENNFTVFLDLLRRLGIQFEELYERGTINLTNFNYEYNESKLNIEIDQLIGVCWLICVKLFRVINYCNINVSSGSNTIAIDVSFYKKNNKNSTCETVTVTEKNTEGNITKVSFNNSEYKTPVFVGKEINDMVRYLTKEALIITPKSPKSPK